MNVINFVMQNGPQIVSAVIAVLTALIAIAMLIPGDQPEKQLQAIVDFLAKFSAKPKE
jgi:hypothetical protein